MDNEAYFEIGELVRYDVLWGPSKENNIGLIRSHHEQRPNMFNLEVIALHSFVSEDRILVVHERNLRKEVTEKDRCRWIASRLEK